jgi:hypothetical protein
MSFVPACRESACRTRAFVALSAFVAVSGLAHAASPEAPSPDFVNDVVPVLTKAGCNTGVCHAKAGGGQNGFELSLLGFEPEADYDRLVLESRGRRVFPGAPEESLILLKPTGQLPHGGGVRFARDSESYRVLSEWIAAGALPGSTNAPQLVSIEVVPPSGSLPRGATVQLQALARFSDGSSRDVTHLALYEANDAAMVEASEDGLVKALDIPGKAAVMVRYQDRVAVHSAAIPSGGTVADVPPSKNFVDDHVFANLKTLGIPPSPVCDDATFIRRATLDIAGRLPTEAEAQAFFADASSDRRDRLVESLLNSPDYADYFANKWASLLKNRRDESSDITANFAFHAWLRDSLLANRPYDQIVRELLAATGTVVGNPPVAWYKRVKEPKQQIEDVAQLFLGVRMQCAQCHHHPFERWSQDDYYSFVAFFSQVGRKPTAVRGEDLIFHERGVASVTNPKTGEAKTPAALGDDVGAIPAGEDPRLRLAEWMGSETNPFFAKALVNRYWKHFFGRGLIEPEDDIRDTNPPTNPELLAALEKSFIESGYDLKELVRVIVRSNAYQLSAEPNEFNLADRQNYSRYYPKRLQAEVLLDAIDAVTGARTDFADLPAGTRAVALPDNSYNRSAPLLKVFGRPESASVCECERVQSASLAQSLYLLNANDIKSKLAVGGGRAEKISKDEAPLEAQVESLYLAAFSRAPRPEERETAVAYFQEPRTDAAGAPVDTATAKRENAQDLLWALINSKEFLFNH